MTMYEQVRPSGLPLTRRGWAGSGARCGCPGVTREQAEQEVTAIAAQIRGQHMAGETFDFDLAVPAQGPEQIRAGVSNILTLSMAIVGLVLLVTCANIAGVQQARLAMRPRELAVRQSLGASRWTLIRLWLTESLVLAGLGGVAGLVVARWVQAGILSMLPPG